MVTWKGLKTPSIDREYRLLTAGFFSKVRYGSGPVGKKARQIRKKARDERKPSADSFNFSNPPSAQQWST